MRKPLIFDIQKKLENGLGRAGVLSVGHGEIETPAFVVVGTKATVKAVTPEQLKDIGVQVVLGNTYHLYLEPGDERVKKAGGINKFMNWSGPTMTDSGGFQVFSLGEVFGTGVTKIAKSNKEELEEIENKNLIRLAKVDDDGVTFKSHIDGSEHRFTPEKSIEIQHNIGADIIFVFDEPTAPLAPRERQLQALKRTHKWAKKCFDYHKKSENSERQALFGIVQGGRYEDLRKLSAKTISEIDFDGFGIGGSYIKDDMGTAVKWVNEILPEDKPRHLLGIGEPEDLFEAIENGCDLFDCVIPTRVARNGQLFTRRGKINIFQSKYRDDFSPIDLLTPSYTSLNYTKAYLAHLFRSKEILGATLASIHNLYFLVSLVKEIRQSIIDGNFFEFKKEFLSKFKRSED